MFKRLFALGIPILSSDLFNPKRQSNGLMRQPQVSWPIERCHHFWWPVWWTQASQRSPWVFSSGV